MDKLVEALAGLGVTTEKLNSDQIVSVAKAMGIDPSEYLPRKVEIVPYTNKRGETNMFVSTDNFTVGKKPDGSPKVVRGAFIRLESLDQLVLDLQTAQGLVRNSQE